MQWNFDTKVKVFHESISCFIKCPWNCTSWNAPKEKFHSAPLPLQMIKVHVTDYLLFQSMSGNHGGNNH